MALETKLELSPKGLAIITLAGELDASNAADFQTQITQAASANCKRLVLIMQDLEYMASAGLRMLAFTKQKMGASVDIYMVGTKPTVQETIEAVGFQYSVIMLETYDAAQIEQF
ncbi:MAG: STAS domain-containing protein [Chloroflexaceae bacterium]|nr:STAS domain-containing protein [Chloroflexaceae bacterium]